MPHTDQVKIRPRRDREILHRFVAAIGGEEWLNGPEPTDDMRLARQHVDALAAVLDALRQEEAARTLGQLPDPQVLASLTARAEEPESEPEPKPGVRVILHNGSTCTFAHAKVWNSNPEGGLDIYSHLLGTHLAEYARGSWAYVTRIEVQA